MESRSRTEYSARNSSVALISQLIHLLVGFLLRIVFTHTLSEECVGVNGLFLDILNILSLSELGVGTAITYALYRPIEEGDVEKQKSLMALFRKFYHLVAVVVLGIGLALIPFMDIIIKDSPNVDHLILIYLLYLASAVSSYLLIYKRTLMDAHQLAYIGTLYNTAAWVIQDIVQILILIFTRNFLLFVCVNLASNIITNVLISRKADRLYPYLKEREILPLSDEEQLDIRKNVGAMFLHKMSAVIVNNTDNLLISAFVGIVSVGKYSNYLLITKSLRKIITSFFQGIMASVGNLGVSKDRERLTRIFHATFFINQWISTFATITLFEVFNLFVGLSFGKKYVFDLPVVIMICINFYLGSLREGILVFRDSLGVFWYDRYKAIAEAIINLITSIILAKFFGTAGVLFGTIISTLTTSAWVEPYMLYKHRLETSLWEFWKRAVTYAVIGGCVFLCTHFICQLYQGSDVFLLLYRFAVCCVVPNGILFLVYYRSSEMQFLISKGRSLLEGKKKPFTDAQQCFLDIMKSNFSHHDVCSLESFDEKTMEQLVHYAKEHNLMSLLYSYFWTYHAKDCPKHWLQNMEVEAKHIILQNYRLWQQSLHLHQLFYKKQIPYVLLKGVSLAGYYDVPELRKSGDIDLWVYQPNSAASEGEVYYGPAFQKMEAVLLQDGYHRGKEQHGNHHVIFHKEGCAEVEVHVLWKEDFQSKELNRDVAHLAEDAYLRSTEYEIAPGYGLPILSEEDQACHMLLHVLQHYLTHGFGWKMLCDWTVFWNHHQDEGVYERFLDRVAKWHLETFVSHITWICMYYLGLDESLAKPLMQVSVDPGSCQELAQEIFSSGEFGYGEEGRMVAPSGSNPIALFGEFHHQMKRNHYEASKQVWRWPYLWVITLVAFVRNNHKLRNISTFKIMRNASRRARLRKKLKVFKDK